MGPHSTNRRHASVLVLVFFFQAEDGIRDVAVTGVHTCALPISSGRFVPDVLLGSRLVRVADAVPAQRPDRSAGGPGGVAVGYTLSSPDGDDGAPLTDYDIIGAADSATGLFALQGVARFNMLCIPPLTRERDVGLSTLLVAARLCRDQQSRQSHVTLTRQRRN